MSGSLVRLNFEVSTLTGYVSLEQAQNYIADLVLGQSILEKDMFCLVVLAHGGDINQIQFSDGKIISLKQLVAPILNTPALFGKPKLFFIQACRSRINHSHIPNSFIRDQFSPTASACICSWSWPTIFSRPSEWSGEARSDFLLSQSDLEGAEREIVQSSLINDR